MLTESSAMLLSLQDAWHNSWSWARSIYLSAALGTDLAALRVVIQSFWTR